MNKVITLFLTLISLVVFLEVNAQQEVVYAKPDKVFDYTDDNMFIDQLRLSFGFGYSRRIDKKFKDISSEMKSFINKLKNGKNFSLEVARFFASRYGIGLYANYHYSSASMSNYKKTDMYYVT
jgi:hypothetical protein